MSVGDDAMLDLKGYVRKVGAVKRLDETLWQGYAPGSWLGIKLDYLSTWPPGPARS